MREQGREGGWGKVIDVVDLKFQLNHHTWFSFL